MVCLSKCLRHQGLSWSPSHDGYWPGLLSRLSLALSVVVMSIGTTAGDWPELDGKVYHAVEALKRLVHLDPVSNPAVGKALRQTLEAVRGRPEYVQLVTVFGLKDKDEALLAFVRRHGDSTSGLLALDYLVKRRDATFLKGILSGEDPGKAVQALGNLSHPTATGLLGDLVTAGDQPLATRESAIRSLCRSRHGVEALLQMHAGGILPSDMSLTAAYAFNQLPWATLKERALGQIPLPQIRGGATLPPVRDLLVHSGDIALGREVFHKAESGCAMCHRIGDQGVDFGPGLDEIGAKLGKDALFQAILDPSAGIAFGYEGWEMVTKAGDAWVGVLVGETETSLTVKTQSAALLTLEKKEIEDRIKMKGSLMPTGLQQAMTVQELVDLVAYLASLPK